MKVDHHKATIQHLVKGGRDGNPNGFWNEALCGFKPSWKTLGWSHSFDEYPEPTCGKCVKVLDKDIF